MIVLALAKDDEGKIAQIALEALAKITGKLIS